MAFRDDEIAFPGNREMVERELSKSVAQVLTLVPGRLPGHLSLQEVGVDMVMSVAFIRASRESAGSFAADIADACSEGSGPPRSSRKSTPDGVPEDIADDYARAKAEVKAILRREQPHVDPVAELAAEISPEIEVAREIR
jgi:hypothetical protein